MQGVTVGPRDDPRITADPNFAAGKPLEENPAPNAGTGPEGDSVPKALEPADPCGPNFIQTAASAKNGVGNQVPPGMFPEDFGDSHDTVSQSSLSRSGTSYGRKSKIYLFAAL